MRARTITASLMIMLLAGCEHAADSDQALPGRPAVPLLAQTCADIADDAIRMINAYLAEGVETGEQADTLSRLGCETMQGYLFSKPVPAAGVLSAVTRIAARTSLTRPAQPALAARS